VPVLKKHHLLFIITSTFIILSGCSYFEGSNLQNVGMLFETTTDNNPWSNIGYESLLEIEKEFNTDVFYHEDIRTEKEVILAVDEFVKDGVNLVIGHGNFYGDYFVDITETYPDVHFVYTNGAIYNRSVTSLNFNSHAMGFFGGMVAGEMTESKEVGVIAAYSWQPELEGFYEGVKYQQPSANIHMDFVNDWNNEEEALEIYDNLKKSGVDVIYPVGNGFSKAVIQAAAADNIYSIGYIADQHELAPESVLTSTIQHVDDVYMDIAKEYNKGDMVGDTRIFDFQDDLISLGTFNEVIPEDFEREMMEAIEEYKETDLLPNEKQ